MAKRLLATLLVAILAVSAAAPAALAGAAQVEATRIPAAQLPAPAVPWQWANPTLPANDLLDVIYAGAQFVAVGGYGTILTSPDGHTWTQQPSGAPDHLKGILYGGDRYVAFGTRGPILVSPDGFAWTRVALPDGAGEIEEMAYGNGTYVALSRGGWLTSPDGATWTLQKRDPAHERPRQIAFGAGRFVAAGLSSVILSTDGITWTEQEFDEYNTPTAMTYTGDRFLILGSRTALTSPDGLTWQAAPLPKVRIYGTEIPVSAMGLSYGGGRLLLTAAEGAIYTSEDGATWQNVSPDPATVPGLLLGIKVPMGAAAYGNSTFVAVGARGMIYTSADGRTWAPLHQTDPALLTGAAYGAGRFVAVGTDGTVLTSPYGTTWVPVPTGQTEDLNSVRFLGDRFVAPGNSGLLLTSKDGLQWERLLLPTEADLNDIAFSGTAYVAVGESGTPFYSADGRAWTAAPSLGDEVSLAGVTFAAGTFVAVGTSNKDVFARHTNGKRFIATSPDGSTWTVRLDERGMPLTSIAYGNGTFVAANEGGQVLRSANATDWTVHPADSPYMISGDGPGWVTFDGRMFVGTVENELRVSGDGIRWMSATLPTGEFMYGLAANDRVHIAVGVRGTILVAGGARSGCGTGFPDVPAAHPACPAVESLAARQVIRGDQWGGFRPHDTLTRAEAAALLARALGWAPAPAGATPFTDTSDHWVQQHGYLQAALAHRAMQGYPDSTFRPDAPVTRAELLKMAAAGAGLEPVAMENPRHWATGWMLPAKRAGLIGQAARYPLWLFFELAPDLPATRAEAAILLANMAR